MKILLIRTGGLGDCILTLPVALLLRELHPDAELHVLGNGNMLAVARLTGLFTGFRSLDEAGFSALFAGNGTNPFLRSFFSPFERVYCFSASNTEEIGQALRDSGPGDCRALDPRLPIGWSRHIAFHLLSILETNLPRTVMLPPLPISVPPLHMDNLLLIHPGSGGIAKNWPLECFLTVAERWPGEVVFLLGPAEMERGFAEKIPDRFRTIPDPPIPEAAALISTASVFLGNDSGVSHLAALRGVRSVALFGPTDPHIWRPLGETVRVIASVNGSMEGIGVREVMETLILA